MCPLWPGSGRPSLLIRGEQRKVFKSDAAGRHARLLWSVSLYPDAKRWDTPDDAAAWLEERLSGHTHTRGDFAQVPYGAASETREVHAASLGSWCR